MRRPDPGSGALLRGYQSRLITQLGDFPHGPRGPRGYQTLTEVVRGEHPSQLALAASMGIDRTGDDLPHRRPRPGRVRRAPAQPDRPPAARGGRDGARPSHPANLEQRVRAAEETVLG
jgi:MarR family transcriptional regulator, transcriptional regulator for hemolysin